MTLSKFRPAPVSFVTLSSFLVVAFSAVLSSGCGKMSGEQAAETNRMSGPQPTEVRGCGIRRTRPNDWSLNLYRERCQVGYMRWHQGTNVNSGGASSAAGDSRLRVNTSTTDSYQDFCSSVEAMHNETPNGVERRARSSLTQSLQQGLRGNAAQGEADLKVKLSELLHCPATFEAGGSVLAIDAIASSSNCSAGGGESSCDNERDNERASDAGGF